MHGERVDGDDLDAVFEAADRLLGAARDERRPAVLEAMTYRYRGHSVADAGLAYRSKQEIADHTAHDPIVRVREQLRADGVDRRSSTRSTAPRTSASPPRWRPRSPAPSRRWTGSPGACTPRAAMRSSRACARAARSAKRS